MQKDKTRSGSDATQAVQTARRPRAHIRPRHRLRPDGRQPRSPFNQSEASLQALINAISDPAILLDREGKLVLASDSFARIIGKDTQRLIGRDPLSFVPAAEAERGRKRIQEVVRTGRPQVTETITPDGRSFQTHVFPLLDASGRVERLVIIQRNITPLKEAQARAQETESRYRTIVESSSDGVITLEHGIITYANRRVLEISGYQPEDLIGHPAQEFIHPQEVAKVAAHLQQRKQNPSYRSSYETILKTHDGRDIYVELTANTLPFPPGTDATLVVLHDITERKKAQAALEEAEARYRSLIDSSVAGIYILRDNRIEFCNQKFAEIFGYAEPKEMIGLPLKSLVAPESLGLVQEQVRRRISGLSLTVNYEVRVLRKNGALIDVEVFGSRFEYRGQPAIQGTIIDITERKRATRDLVESSARLQTLLQAIPDVVYFKDASGRNLIINKAFEKMVGLPADKIQGRTDSEIFPPELAEKCHRSDLAVRKARTAVRFVESFSMGAQSEIHYETLKAPILDETGKLAGLVGVSRDITEQKRNEKIRSSILSIAQAALSSESFETFLGSIRDIIAQLMPAKNFYIALHDEPSGLLTFPYFVDEFEAKPEPQPLGHGLTEYVLRTGQPLLVTPEVFAELTARGEVESIGPPAIDWLGVPLTIGERTIGVLVVQSYTPGIRYGEIERDILRFVSGQVAMSLQRRRSDDEIRDREQFLAGVLNSIQDGISILDTDYTILRVNRSLEQWYAHALPLVGKKCYQAYHLRSEPCLICPTRKTLVKKEAAYEIVPKVGPEGIVSGWLDLFSYPFIDQKTGQMKGVIEYIRNITERKLAEDRLQASLQEKEVLLREIHHRVKNNLQVIQSLISLQSRRIKDGQALDMYKESQRRIRSMALIHERLYQSANLSRIDFADYLRSLVVHIFHSVLSNTGRVELKLDLEPVELNINIAIPCGLIASELVSNALKHAFPEERSGEVVVSLHRGADSSLRLGVRDDGIGLPPEFDIGLSESLGMQIVMTLVSQIDGQLRIGRERGADFEVEFRESGGRA